MEGTVKWYDRKKGYGFVAGEDGQEYFVHYSGLPRGVFLWEGDKVSFEPGETDKGKQATNVQLLQKASEMQGAEKPAEEPATEESTEEQPEEEAPAEEEASEEQPEEEEKQE